MEGSKDKSLDQANRLIAAVQRRLSWQHTAGLMGWFTLAGLSLAFVPLSASKIHFCNAWTTTVLPILTIFLAVLFGAIGAWTSRPSLKAAALKIDRSLASKELFVTALESPTIDPALPIHRLFCQTLEEACKRGDVRHIAPSPVTQVSKFLAIILLVDAALLATPNVQRAHDPQLERLQDHVEQWLETKKDLTTAEKLAVNSLNKADTPQALHAAAKKLWLKLKTHQQSQTQEFLRQLDDLESAIHAKDLKAAKKLVPSLREALHALNDKKSRDLAKKRLQEIANNSSDPSLSRDIKSLGKDSNCFSAGLGNHIEEKQDKPDGGRAQALDAMEDLLITVFGGLGKAPPKTNSPVFGSEIKKNSRQVPEQVQSSSHVSALGLSRTEERYVMKYLELRRARR